MHVLYYISGHGFGHGLRCAAIANALPGDAELTLKTNLPRSFFDEELRRPFNHCAGEFDCGCSQIDAIAVDIPKTLATYAAIADRNRALLAEEVDWCRQNGVTHILSDIVPFAFSVAAGAAIPSFGISNFTWYEIYTPYCAANPWFKPYLAEIERQYRMATLFLALEPANELSWCGRIKTIGLVGRCGVNRRTEIQNFYGIKDDRAIGLVYTGSYGMDTVPWSRLEAIDGWEFIGAYPVPDAPSNYHYVRKGEFSYRDLSASVDCVISKVGYGVFSECLMHGVPLLYLPRDDFAEYPVLESAVIRWGNGLCLPREQFYSLTWANALQMLHARPKPVPVHADGARQCAMAITSFGAACT